MNIPILTGVHAREILDSRGYPTVEAVVRLHSGAEGTAAVPSGASTGTYEALELRDGDPSRYGGRGVTTAVRHINAELASVLCGQPCDPFLIDHILLETDGTPGKTKLGANALLAVSLAAAKAAAADTGLPLYRFLGGQIACRLPVPMMNILNGGAHAGNNLDVQELMIVPHDFPSFREALRAGCEIYHALGSLLKQRGNTTAVGDEGGFAPDFASLEAALDAVTDAIEKAGYAGRVSLALDVAASEWFENGVYHLPKADRTLTGEELCSWLTELCGHYPLCSVEDGMGEDDRAGWRLLTDALGGRVALVGDDLFVTNRERLRSGISDGIANAILVKPNQIGTLSETLEVIAQAARSRYRAILSHRSGETEDTTVADIAVACGCGYIKTGAPCRSERTAKYNRLLRIEEELGSRALYYFDGSY